MNKLIILVIIILLLCVIMYYYSNQYKLKVDHFDSNSYLYKKSVSSSPCFYGCNPPDQCIVNTENGHFYCGIPYS